MPVLEISEYEIVTLLGDLRTEINDWDGRIQGSAPRKVEWINRNINECLALRERLQDAACSTTEDESEKPLLVTEITEAEAKRRAAVADMIITECKVIEFVNGGKPPTEATPESRGTWHSKLGWLPKTRSPILKEVEAFNKAVNVSWGLPHRRAAMFGKDIEDLDGDLPPDDFRKKLQSFDAAQDQVSPGTWTTLPDEFDVDGRPYDVTKPEEKASPCWHDMENQSDGLIERPDGYRIAI